MSQKIQLSDHFTFSKMLRFTLPSIVMMVFTSTYSIVDGLFVANAVGKEALASVNIIFPLFSVIGAFGFMLGTGGSAIVARTLGEGDKHRANRYFTMFLCAILVTGVLLSALCIAFMKPLGYLLGANDDLIDLCVSYGRILAGGMTAFMLQTSFQAFFVTAERPKLGLLLTVLSGLTNMFGDWFFIVRSDLGITGAAWATVLGYCVGGVLPLLYFALPNHSLLRLCKTKPYPKILLSACANGSSEMVTNMSMALTTFLFNTQMMRLAGPDGVSAVTAVMYLGFLFIAVLIGFSMGIAPVIGFQYGARNHAEMKNLLCKCLWVVAAVSVFMLVLPEIFAPYLVRFFLREEPLCTQTTFGFRIFSLQFLLCGLNIFASSFFTSLCNGKISALISFLRTLLLQVAFLLLLPIWWKELGVWLAVPLTELFSAFVSVFFLVRKRKQYGY